MTQLFEASSVYQIMVITAALDADLFDPADRRILLVSMNSTIPEVRRRIDEDPAIAPLLRRFDRVASYNDLIAPLHPTAFRVREADAVLIQRAFRRGLDIPADHVVELALESIQAPPSRTIMNVFADSPITVYAEGLMSYGPTRERLTAAMASRLRRVLYLDLIPGLTPMLLTEDGVAAEAVPDAAFRAVVASLAVEQLAPVAPPAPYALVLGQYLADLGLVTNEVEADLYGDLIEAAAARGFARVVYKPHPSAPTQYVDALRHRAQQLGVEFALETRPVPVEAIYDRTPPGLVLGCFSTGLVTATRFWSIPAASIGARRVLTSLPTVEDSNRIPLVIVDRAVPTVSRTAKGVTIAPAAVGAGSVDALQRGVHAVGYAMQWQAHRARRAAVLRDLRGDASDMRRCIPRTRLRMLALPGGFPLALDAGTFDRLAESLRVLSERRTAVTSRLGRIAAWPRVARRHPDPDF